MALHITRRAAGIGSVTVASAAATATLLALGPASAFAAPAGAANMSNPSSAYGLEVSGLLNIPGTPKVTSTDGTQDTSLVSIPGGIGVGGTLPGGGTLPLGGGSGGLPVGSLPVGSLPGLPTTLPTGSLPGLGGLGSGLPGGLAGNGALYVKVLHVTANGNQSTARASVADVDVLNLVKATVVTASCHGATGASTVATLQIGGQDITQIAGHGLTNGIAPNTTIELPTGTGSILQVILNKQVRNNEGGVTVTALAVRVLGSTLDVNVSQASCGHIAYPTVPVPAPKPAPVPTTLPVTG